MKMNWPKQTLHKPLLPQRCSQGTLQEAQDRYPSAQTLLSPPWVQEISSGILSLHNKVDLSRNELAQYEAEIQAQGIRVSHLESVAHEHTQQLLEAQRQIQIHEARIKELGKVPELEKRLNELEAAKRCLTPPQPSTMRGPPSPRSSLYPKLRRGQSRRGR